MTKNSKLLYRLLGIVLLIGTYPVFAYIMLNPLCFSGSTGCSTNPASGVITAVLMPAAGIFLIALSKSFSKDDILKWLTIVITGISIAAISGFVFSDFGKDTYLPLLFTAMPTLLWVTYYFKGRKYVKGLGFIKIG